VPEENGSQAPTGNTESQPLAQNPSVSFPKKGEVGQGSTDDPYNKENASNGNAGKVHWVNHATFWSQIGIFIIGIFALAIYYQQLQQMIDATRATQDAAYDACISAKIARQTLIELQAGTSDTHNLVTGTIAQASATTLSESAVLTINGPGLAGDVKSGQKVSMGIQISNIGKTPARGVQIHVTARLVKEDEEPDFTKPHYMDPVYTGVVYPGLAIGGLMDLRDESGKQVILDDTQVQNFRSGQTYIVSFGKAEYRDIFGVSHWLTFCGYNDLRVLNPEDHSMHHQKCAAYNNADTNQYLSAPKPLSDQIKSTPIEDIACPAPKH
jgi:hypothetical protein